MVSFNDLFNLIVRLILFPKYFKVAIVLYPSFNVTALHNSQVLSHFKKIVINNNNIKVSLHISIFSKI